MRKARLHRYGLILLVILMSIKPTPSAPIEDHPRTIEEFLRLGSRPWVIAHRGFSGVAPENTLAAFRKAMEVGADMIELDVQLTGDGQVVCIHDDTLDRTTDRKGPIGKMTADEIRTADAGKRFAPEFTGEKVPLLSEVLDLVKERILLNIEIKTESVTDTIAGGIVEKTIQLVNERGMRGQVILSSFNPKALKQAKQLDPAMATASLYDRDLQVRLDPAAIMDEAGSRAFNLSKTQVTSAVVRDCHATGRPTAVYTIDDEPTMKLVIEMGADAIFTNRPDQMLALLARNSLDIPPLPPTGR